MVGVNAQSNFIQTNRIKKQAAISSRSSNQFSGKPAPEWWREWWKQYINEVTDPTVRPILGGESENSLRIIAGDVQTHVDEEDVELAQTPVLRTTQGSFVEEVDQELTEAPVRPQQQRPSRPQVQQRPEVQRPQAQQVPGRRPSTFPRPTSQATQAPITGRLSTRRPQVTQQRPAQEDEEEQNDVEVETEATIKARPTARPRIPATRPALEQQPVKGRPTSRPIAPQTRPQIPLRPAPRPVTALTPTQEQDFDDEITEAPIRGRPPTPLARPTTPPRRIPSEQPVKGLPPGRMTPRPRPVVPSRPVPVLPTQQPQEEEEEEEVTVPPVKLINGTSSCVTIASPTCFPVPNTILITP